MPSRAAQILRWKEPSTPRANRLDTRKWEQHKTEICKFYIEEGITLSQLIMTMKQKHNFMASRRRQYIFQFEKWGLHKYKYKSTSSKKPWFERQLDILQQSSNEYANSQAKMLPTSNNQLTHMQDSINTNNEILETSITGANSMVNSSICQPSSSQQQNSSWGYTPIGPVRSEDSPPTIPVLSLTIDDFTSTEVVTSTDGTVLPTTTRMVWEDITPLDGVSASTTTGPKNSASHSVSHLPSCCRYHVVRPDTINIDPNSFKQGANLNEEHGCESRLSFQNILNPDVPESVDVGNLETTKCAADLLFCLGLHSTAYGLYYRIYDQTKYSSAPTLKIDSALVACARSAAKPSQLKTVQDLLQARLDQLRDSPQHPFQRCLFTGLIGYTHSRFHSERSENWYNSRCLEENNFRISLDYADPLHPLPTRSFDLIAYFLRDRDYNGVNVGHKQLYQKSNIDHILNSEEKGARRFITAVPGPFELKKDGRLTHDYIRSCILWCSHQRDTLIAAKPPSVSYSSIFKDQDSNAIFCNLWKRLQNDLEEYAEESLESLRWAREVENRMGISLTEFLYIIYRMIIEPAPVHAGKLYLPHHISSKLLNTDFRLACEFLYMFTKLNTLSTEIPGKGYTRMPQSTDAELEYTIKLITYQEQLLQYATNIIEKSLKISLPKERNSGLVARAEVYLQTPLP